MLRPIFDAERRHASRRKAAVKIWRDADRKARLCAALAGQQSLDPFDGYLAGLLHNSGWTALLRAIDGFEDLRSTARDLAHPDGRAAAAAPARRAVRRHRRPVEPEPGDRPARRGGRPARPRRACARRSASPCARRTGSPPCTRWRRPGIGRPRPCPAGRRCHGRCRTATPASAETGLTNATADLSSRLAAGADRSPRAPPSRIARHDTPHHPARCRARPRRRGRRLPAARRFAAKTLVYCSEGSPEGFNPQFFTTGTTLDASSVPIYNRLVEFELGTTNIVPGLAESWTATPDGLSYTFKLRKGVKFHSNSKFTPTRDFNADDVLFSYNRMADPNHPLRQGDAGPDLRVLRGHGHEGHRRQGREGRPDDGALRPEEAGGAVHGRHGDGLRVDPLGRVRRQDDGRRRRPTSIDTRADRHRPVPVRLATRRTR